MKRYQLLRSTLLCAVLSAGAYDVTAAENGKAEGEYVPMLEVGKEWRYTVHDCRSFTDVWNDDYEFKFRVDGKTEIDGKEYFVINEYAECPYEEDTMRPYGYMREDLDTKTVFWRVSTEWPYRHIGFPQSADWFDRGKEYLIYSFDNYDLNQIIHPVKTYGHERNLIYTEIEANDGIHRGYMLEGDEEFGCFEGIGLIMRPEKTECMWYYGICDLTGFYSLTWGGGEISPFLYAVVAPDGTEIFSNDKHRSGAGLESVSADGSADGEVEYYNVQGMRILNPTEGTICIRRQGATVTKVMIR